MNSGFDMLVEVSIEGLSNILDAYFVKARSSGSEFAHMITPGHDVSFKDASGIVGVHLIVRRSSLSIQRDDIVRLTLPFDSASVAFRPKEPVYVLTNLAGSFDMDFPLVQPGPDGTLQVSIDPTQASVKLNLSPESVAQITSRGLHTNQISDPAEQLVKAQLSDMGKISIDLPFDIDGSKDGELPVDGKLILESCMPKSTASPMIPASMGRWASFACFCLIIWGEAAIGGRRQP